MSRFVRASKVRHLFTEDPKADKQFQELKLASVQGDHSYVKGNNTFFSVAVRGGGGAVLVHPLNDPCRMKTGHPTLNTHSSAVLDMDWNPFNEHQLATASEDLHINIVNIPEGGLTEKITEAAMTLSGHERKVTFVKWHPTANGVLASGSADGFVIIWDTTTGEEKLRYEVGALIQDLQWSPNGALLGISAKDKTIRILDPRKPDEAQTINAHDGAKCAKMCFLDAKTFVTCGFSSRAKREIKLWDLGAEKEKKKIEVDSGSGVLFPFWDEGIKVLYVLGKGDGNMRYFEVVEEAPFLHPLSEFRSPKSAKGIYVLPRKGNDVMACEVTRVLKLTSNSVIPHSFKIPRKSDLFQKDIFPDCYAHLPANTAEGYFSGTDAEPVKCSMDPKKDGEISGAVVEIVAKKTYAELEKELAEAYAKIAELEKKLAA